MAAKKTTLKELGEMIERGFAAVASDIADVKSTLAEHTKILNYHTKTLADHTNILNDHTRDLAIIKHDVTNNLDKRLQLEVRVTMIERHLGLDKKVAA